MKRNASFEIIDSHCDILYQMFGDPQVTFDQTHAKANVSLPRLREGNVRLQFFAIYLSERMKQPSFLDVLTSIDLFRGKVLKHPDVINIANRQQLTQWENDRSKLGAMLTMEGADTLVGNPVLLRTIFELGVRMMGITWNHANWAADGVGEDRNGGFSRKGKQFIKDCNELGMILDAAHLSETGFWELVELSEKPFVVSHANAKSVCDHPRNLSDQQIQALVRLGGRLGITFVPQFIGNDRKTAMSDLIRHIEHICTLGGADCLGFGSDFDGIDEPLAELSHPGHFENVINCLLKYFSPDLVRKWTHANWLTFLHSQLPE